MQVLWERREEWTPIWDIWRFFQEVVVFEMSLEGQETFAGT